jgi:hypothetical protein
MFSPIAYRLSSASFALTHPMPNSCNCSNNDLPPLHQIKPSKKKEKEKAQLSNSKLKTLHDMLTVGKKAIF